MSPAKKPAAKAALKKRVTKKTRSKPASKAKAVSSAKKKTATSKKSPAARHKKKPRVALKSSQKEAKILKPKTKNTLLPKPKDGYKFGVPQSFALTLIAIPKLPVDIDALAVGLARYGGFSLLILGALFTYLNAAPLNLAPHQSVASLTGTSETTDSSSGSSTETLDPKPVATFMLSMEAPLHEEVRINIAVPRAKRVDVLVYEREAKQNLPIGTATKKSSTEWEIIWNTNKFPNGSYRIKAIIINEFGSYEQVNESFIAVQNGELESNLTQTEPTSGASTETETTDTEVTADSVTSVTTDTTGTIATTDQTTAFSINFRPLRSTAFAGDFLLEADTSALVESVIFKAAHERGDIYTIGRGEKVSATGFTIKWNTKLVNDGAYYVYAVTNYQKQNYQTKKTLINVKNTTTEVTDVAETTSTVDPSTTADISKIFSLSITPTVTDSLSEIATFNIRASHQLDRVELFGRKTDSTQSLFLGDAKKVSDYAWRITWDTGNTPNGTYVLFTRAWANQKVYFGSNLLVSVLNKPKVAIVDEPATEQNNTADSLITKEIIRLSDTREASTTSQSLDLGRTTFITERITDSVVIAESDVPELLETSPEQEADVTKKVDQLLEQYRTEIDGVFTKLTSALRSNDQTAIAEAKRQISLLKTRLFTAAASNDTMLSLIEVIENRLERNLVTVALRTEQSEKIIRERVGAEAFVDTDGDGITDFDERTLYNTDPATADTDKDGFNDGVEILRGYDPLDATPESKVEFESPKVAGTVRADVFEVTAITSVAPEREPEFNSSANLAALISGRGLPNSFVTLYIFSNPTVVTVKTDADGNWAYTFDKEIADGKHEIYVGVTDNAGRVVAKSEPISFIKTAEAFTPVDAAEAADLVVVSQVAPDSLLSKQSLLLVASISVVAIGAILILLGLHIRRREDEVLQEVTKQTPQLV